MYYLCKYYSPIILKSFTNKNILDSYKEINSNQFIKIKSIVKNLDSIKND